MLSFMGNKKSVAGGGTSDFYGKPGLNLRGEKGRQYADAELNK